MANIKAYEVIVVALNATANIVTIAENFKKICNKIISDSCMLPFSGSVPGKFAICSYVDL